ncbi:UNVERIFIED_CONTAM: hypothetical protein GTU68_021511 [Idotea baltica]|nr:hypothetical protein [Idotea baltica]
MPKGMRCTLVVLQSPGTVMLLQKERH